MILVEFNRRLGALLAQFPRLGCFDLTSRNTHLRFLKEKYELTMDEIGNMDTYRLSNNRNKATVSFISAPGVLLDGVYANVTTNLSQSSSIPLTEYSQLKLEELFESIFTQLSDKDKAKRAAGYKAVDDYVKNRMVVGLGTGSTAYYAVERVGQKVRLGLLNDIKCIPTSERTKEQADNLNLNVITLDNLGDRGVDVAIDGADAVDKRLNLIKGGGGALLREKMVEIGARKFICIVDDTKLCDTLGPSFALPVEVVPFCYEHTMRMLAGMSILNQGTPRLRTGDISNNKNDNPEHVYTDNGNYIIDVVYDTSNSIKYPQAAANTLKNTVGVIEHGLFCGMAKTLIVAKPDGSCIVYGENGITPDW